MSNSLDNMQHFFEQDIKLKKEIYNMCPPSDYIDEDSLMKYTDNLQESINYIFSEFKRIAADFFEGNSRNLLEANIDKYEKKVIDEFNSCGLDINKLRSFYKNYISDMKEEFVDSVKVSCVGDKFVNYLYPISKANTINEYIHYFHSYILNSCDVLRKIPINSERLNREGYPIRLRGFNSNRAIEIFKAIPFELECGFAEIIAVNENKIIMMFRDLGHATTIEVSLDNGNAKVEYFVPKLNNIELINYLPGVNKVNENSVGATGSFEVKEDNLTNSIVNFISRVPTDKNRNMDSEKSTIQIM